MKKMYRNGSQIMPYNASDVQHLKLERTTLRRQFFIKKEKQCLKRSILCLLQNLGEGTFSLYPYKLFAPLLQFNEQFPLLVWKTVESAI